MKKIRTNILKLILIIFSFVSPVSIFSQDPPPPPSHNSQGNVPGGGAGIDGGLLILISIGAAYAGKKILARRARTNDE